VIWARSVYTKSVYSDFDQETLILQSLYLGIISLAVFKIS